MSDLGAYLQPVTQATDIAGYVPQFVPETLGVGATSNTPALDPKAVSNTNALVKKYQAIGPQIAQLPADIRNAMINYDATRVSRGMAPIKIDANHPLQGDPTGLMLQTALQNRPATPTPERSPLNIVGNTLSDLSDLVHALPRLPITLLREVTKLPGIGGSIADAEAHGENLIQAITQAPGIRMIPGAFTVGNLAGGVHGAVNALSHPLMTALDVLPVASEAAKLTEAGQVAERVAAETGSATPRPLVNLIKHSVGDAVDPLTGLPTRELVARPATQAVRAFMAETSFGQKLTNMFGNRPVVQEFSNQNQLVSGAAAGTVAPETDASGALTDFGQKQAFTREAIKIQEKYPDIAPADVPIIMRAAQSITPLDQLPASHLAYINEMYDLANRMGAADVANRVVGQAVIGGKAEIFTPQVARGITTAQNAAARASDYLFARNEIMSPTLDPQQYLDRIQQVANAPRTPRTLNTQDLLDARANGAMSAREMRTNIRAAITALDTSGFDTSTLRAIQHTGHLIKNYRGLFDDITLDGLKRTNVISPEDLAASIPRMPRPASTATTPALQRLNALDTRAYETIRTSINRGDWSDAIARSSDLLKRANPPEFVTGDFLNNLRRLRDRDTFLNSSNDGLGGFTERFADKTAAAATKRETALPARFGPLVQHLAQQQYLRVFNPTDAADIADAIMKTDWNRVPGYSEEMAREIRQDIADNWQTLRDADGHDPMFTHTVKPSRINQVMHPQVTPSPTQVTHALERGLDATPGIQHLGIAVTHQALESTQNAASLRAINTVTHAYGIPEADLVSRYAQQAMELSQRPGNLLDYQGELQRLINRRYVKFNQAGFNVPGLDTLGHDNILLPRSVVKTMNGMIDSSRAFGGIFDGATRTYRLAVMGLSPKILLRTLVGHAIFSVGQIGLAETLRHMNAAWDIVHGDADAIAAHPGLGQSLGQMERFFGDVDAKDLSTQGMGIAEYLKGRTLARLGREASTEPGALSTAVHAAADFNMKYVSLFDNFYRTIAFLSGEKSALERAGEIGAELSPEQAANAGLEMARKTLMDYTRFTPFERTIVKSIFPFYGFMSHVVRYAFNFPFDHPVRAELINALGRAEEEDNSHALGTNFLSAIFLGHPDNQGRVHGLDMGGLNPFTDVAHLLTLQGFLGGMNPIIRTALQAVGVEHGDAELYPTLRYDAASGRMINVHPNPLLSFVENTVPQAKLVTSLAGLNEQFKSTMAANPAAAVRSLGTDLGLPLVYRQYNLPQEQFAAEKARQDSQTMVLKAALSSGDWTEALKYPGLRPLYTRLTTMSPAQQAALLQTFAPQQASAVLAKITPLIPEPATGESGVVGGA